MSSVISSSAANPTSSSCAQVPYQIPTDDIACAVAEASPSGLPSNYADLMKGCCKDAPVEKYASDCGLYCLSIGQSVSDLNSCFMEAGIRSGSIFCNGNNTATATATEAPSGAKETGQESATGTGAPQESEGAATALVSRQSVSKAGLGMLAVLFVSAVAGALV